MDVSAHNSSTAQGRLMREDQMFYFSLKIQILWILDQPGLDESVKTTATTIENLQNKNMKNNEKKHICFKIDFEHGVKKKEVFRKKDTLQRMGVGFLQKSCWGVCVCFWGLNLRPGILCSAMKLHPQQGQQCLYLCSLVSKAVFKGGVLNINVGKPS